MEGSFVAPAAIVASIGLSAVTLGTFAFQQYYGPDSAVRRFEAAVKTKDWRQVQESVIDPANSFAVGFLVETVQGVQASGATLRTIRTVREGRSATVQTSIDLPGNRAISMIWQVRRNGGAWRVDANATLNFLGQ